MLHRGGGEVDINGSFFSFFLLYSRATKDATSSSNSFDGTSVPFEQCRGNRFLKCDMCHPFTQATTVGGTWVFSYGANMNESRLRRRGFRTGPLGFVRTILDGHRLTFNHKGFFFDRPSFHPERYLAPIAGGYANVVICAEPGACVHGVALYLTPSDKAILSEQEDGYELVDCVLHKYPSDDGEHLLHGQVYDSLSLSLSLYQSFMPPSTFLGRFGMFSLPEASLSCCRYKANEFASKAGSGTLVRVPTPKYRCLLVNGCRDQGLDSRYHPRADLLSLSLLLLPLSLPTCGRLVGTPTGCGRRYNIMMTEGPTSLSLSSNSSCERR